ncbi:acyl-coenzyme A synthetase ACSM3, mitochondrial [Galendromus occidentalis]|uniref:medium-chain acyl-CoA ligase n=1 Tax=Galendromus occidentalis TaxID=34638 RepID=A0AAJ6VZR0_9ACAR|nr:acyl-coenzyme A synthetase ACSM3, mitochondrial [Galendromus occidentalis]
MRGLERMIRALRSSGVGTRNLNQLASRRSSESLYAPEETINHILSSGDLSETPERFNFARDIIEYWAKRENRLRNDRVPALWTVEQGSSSRKYSYRELSELSKRIAGVFRDLGLEKGDRLLVCLPKCSEFWTILLGAIRYGLEICLVTSQATSEDLRLRITRFDPRVVISEKLDEVDSACADAQVMHKISPRRKAKSWKNLNSLLDSANDFDGHQTSENDPCLIFFTSGTTGKPKMVEHSHSYTLAHVLTGKYYQCLEPSDIYWCMTDPGWSKVAWATFPTWLFGAGVFVDTSSRFSAQDTLKTLREFPVTKFCAPPTAYRTMLANSGSTDSFRFPKLNDCLSAGEPLNPEAYRAWKRLTGVDIREGFGQSETMLIASTPRGQPIKPGSVGPPMKEHDIRVLDDDGNPVPRGTIGHLGIRVSPRRPLGLFRGYRGDPEKTSAAFKNDFYLTGDKVCADEDGYLRFVSRSDDVITSSGYRIGPFEVESVLLEHDAVLESGVIGVPDPQRFEVIKAFIVLNDNYLNHDPQELIADIQAFVRRKTAPYKYPRQIEFVKSLPKNIGGKIQRNLLREMERERRGA